MIDSSTGSDLSRRSLVKSAATVAAVGGALVLAGPVATADAAAKTEQVPAARAPEQHADSRVMVRVLDARTGALEVYTATGHRTVIDPALAAALTRLAR
jgi:hypothetical protein